jgi:hypothetical protein
MEPLRLADLTEAELAAIAGITPAELRARVACLRRYEDEYIEAQLRRAQCAQEPQQAVDGVQAPMARPALRAKPR